MKKTLGALFLLVGLGGFAAEMDHNWIDLDVDEIKDNKSRTWPSDGTNYEATECFVTNTANAEYEYEVECIAITNTAPLYVIPTKSAPVNDDNYAFFQLNMKFDAYATLPELRKDVSFGVIAYASDNETNYWVAVSGDVPCWSNTLIAAEVEVSATVSLSVSNGVDNATFADWTFGERHFVYPVGKLTKLEGPIFLGMGSVSDCWGSIMSIGEQVEFWLVSGFNSKEEELKLPAEILVSITNSHGTAIEASSDGKYTYSDGKDVFITYSLTNGWVFCGTGSPKTSETFKVSANAHVVLGGDGIWPYDFGADGSWMIIEETNEMVYAITRLDTATAMGLMDIWTEIVPCYSSKSHGISLTDGGKTITVDAVKYEALDRRHYYQNKDGSIGINVDDCEYAITSFEVDPNNADQFKIGSITNSYDGFVYYVEYSDDPSFSGNYSDTYDDCVRGTNGTIKLVAPKGDGTKRFYRIGIDEYHGE